MNTLCLKFFVSDSHRHQGQMVHEWLLDLAKNTGISGGSAFRAIAGYGRHHRHDEGFFELAGELPVVVEFLTDSILSDRLLARVNEAGLKLVYARLPAETGVTD